MILECPGRKATARQFGSLSILAPITGSIARAFSRSGISVINLRTTGRLPNRRAMCCVISCGRPRRSRRSKRRSVGGTCCTGQAARRCLLWVMRVGLASHDIEGSCFGADLQ
jgi:hypothetical protein